MNDSWGPILVGAPKCLENYLLIILKMLDKKICAEN